VVRVGWVKFKVDTSVLGSGYPKQFRFDSLKISNLLAKMAEFDTEYVPQLTLVGPLSVLYTDVPGFHFVPAQGYAGLHDAQAVFWTSV